MAKKVFFLKSELKFDINFIIVFNKELRDCKSQIAELQSKWYEAIRVDNQSEDDVDDAPETSSQKTERTNSTISMSSRTNILS